MTKDPVEWIYSELKRMGVVFQTQTHEPLHTCEDAERLRPNIRGGACKNLFARNKKGDEHYLIIASPESRINLRLLKKALGATALSFASEKRLQNYLQTKPGSVSPLGLVFDQERQVRVVLDQKLVQESFLNFHPNDNRQTVEIPQSEFLRFLSDLGYQPIILDFPSDHDLRT